LAKSGATTVKATEELKETIAFAKDYTLGLMTTDRDFPSPTEEVVTSL